MSGIFYRDESGKEHQIKEVEGISGNGRLVVQTDIYMREEDLDKISKRLSEQFGEKVIVLDRRITKIFQLSK